MRRGSGWSEEKPRKRGPSRWAAFYRGEDGHRHYAGTHSTEAEAEDAWREALRAIRRGEWIDPRDGKITLQQYIEGPWAEAWKPTVEIRTWSDYMSKLRTHVYPFLGDKEVGSLRHSVMQAWVNDLGKVVSPRTKKRTSATTIKKTVTILRLVLHSAVQDRILDSDPTAALRLPKTRNVKEIATSTWKVLPTRDAAKFLKALEAQDRNWRLMLLLTLQTGCRFAEIRGLRREDLDAERNVVVIADTIGESTKKELDLRDASNDWPEGQYRIGKCFFYKPSTKTNQKRDVPIAKRLMDELVAYCDDLKLEDDSLIFTSKRGLPIGSSWFNSNVLHPFLASADLPQMRFHDLRHTMISWLHERKIPMTQIMGRAGHASMATTNLYTHVVDATSRDAVDAIDQILGL